MGLVLGVVALSAFLAELFPTRLRYSGLALTFGLASALFGRTTTSEREPRGRYPAAPVLAWKAARASCRLAK